MAVTYGFYNALNHDRLYDAIQMSSIFDGIIRDGIFSTIGDTMIVTAPEDGMYVNVGSGRAWFNHTWTLNDTDYPIEAEEAEVVLDRIDAVILEVNSSAEVRANSIKFLKGTPSSNPVKPTLTHNAEVNQYALAYVRIKAGQTTIFQSDIENAVGTDETPFITGVLQQVSIETLLKQWEAEFNTYFTNFQNTSTTEFNNWFATKVSEYTAWFAQMQTDMDSNFNEFDAWFQNIKNQLDQDQAGHLQLQIDALNAEMPFIGGSKININFEYEVVPNKQYSNEHYKLTVGDTVRENNFSSSKLHFDEYGILTVGDGILEVTYDVTDSRTGKVTHASCTYTIKMPYFGRFAYNVTISANVYNYQGWLESIGKNTSSYPTIEDVFADEKLLRELMTRHASVDYLVEWLANINEDAHTVLDNDYCAKWINLRDYALDKLYANPTIKAVMDEVDKYGYGEWTLVNPIHKMERDMGINGIASSSGANDIYPAWHAFDRNDDTVFAPNVDTPRESFYLRYSFSEATKISDAEIRATSYNATYYYNIKIQASNDGNTWEDISNDLQIKEDGVKGTEVLKFEIIHSDYYKHYQIICSSTNAASMYVNTVAALFINDVKFYAWQPKGNVPVMTSNTAPYGEAFASSSAGASYQIYNVFDGNTSTEWGTSLSTNQYIGYKFTNPICVRKIRVITKEAKVFTVQLQGSNDNSTWENIGNTLQTPIEFSNVLNNSSYFLYYRINCTDSSGSTFNTLEINFYGRQLNVSVPSMTSNTAPWGEAFASKEYDTNYQAWKAFNGVAASESNRFISINKQRIEDWFIGYDFGKKIKVKVVSFVYATNGPTNSASYSFRLQGSNDGVTWENISDAFENVSARNFTKFTVSIYSNNQFDKFRLIVDSADVPYVHDAGIYGLSIGEVQFYGLDYSEREFEEGSTMKYLYDHGVELEPLESYGSGTHTKQVSYLEINYNASNSVGGFRTSNKIDFTNYILQRQCVGDIISGTNYAIETWKDLPSHSTYSTQRLSSKSATNDMLPNNVYDEITNINENVYSCIGMTSNGLVSVHSTVKEWWLE